MKLENHGLADDQRQGDREAELRAYGSLDANYLFHGRAARFEFECRQGVLTVRGSVPTFYLKQMLQRLLIDVEGVRQVDNQVRVTSIHATGNPRST